ncbi:MAG: hypothetical protein OXI22_03930 [Defluviicoccus sp.]|nr:hypothetical protein [Defluviicoccus sp.]
MPELNSSHAEYLDRCQTSWNELFDAAKEREELQFAFALCPEFRGMQDPGWSTAEEASRALEQYLDLLNRLESTPIRARISLSLYSHLSEASGLYEVPKNMMRIASGEDYNLWPFQHLTGHHKAAGTAISPNANKVMKDLLGHAHELELERLKSLIVETFDSDLRNGYAHADYIIWNDGIRLRKRNGGFPSVVPYDEFDVKLTKAIMFFQTLQDTIGQAISTYSPPKRISGRLNKDDPVMPAIIAYDESTGSFSIRTGQGL